MPISAGIHHITAISGPAARNVAFYTDTLGLRLVKKTVNFDDPGTYHLYYGDETGQPGTILTFFPWADVPARRPGRGETSETRFLIPEGAVSFWIDRLITRQVEHDAPVKLFGETVIRFRDPDGMPLALVARRTASELPGYAVGNIAAESAIRGFAGAALSLGDIAGTARVLEEAFGWKSAGTEGKVTRYLTPADQFGAHIDLEQVEGARPAVMGAGSVHHIAFRAANDANQAEMAEALQAMKIGTTEQKERNYFRSVYFREPGGIIFEIATDDPGFAVDEPVETLGQALKLPEWLEKHRSRIEAALPSLAPAHGEAA